MPLRALAGIDRVHEPRNGYKILFELGWTMGIEPTTTGATILCSTN